MAEFEIRLRDFPPFRSLTVMEVLEAVFDSVSVSSTVDNVLLEDLSTADLFPLKVVGEHVDVFTSTTAWSSEQENSSH